jgi:nicotinamidase-related amidase
MTTALIVIDVQESFRQREAWAHIDNPDIADTIAPLVDHTRAGGGHVIWVLHSEPGSGTTFDPETGHVRLLPGLKPDAGEPTLIKTSHNAFTTTNLAQILVQRGVTDLLITGIKTEQCCETTARVASDLGYHVRFVLDATATAPLALWDGSGTLTAAQVKDRTASALHGRFAEVVTAEQVLAS